MRGRQGVVRRRATEKVKEWASPTAHGDEDDEDEESNKCRGKNRPGDCFFVRENGIFQTQGTEQGGNVVSHVCNRRYESVAEERTMHKWLSADVDVVVDAIGNRVEVECTLLAPGGLSQVRWQQGHGFLSVIREGRRRQHWLIGGGMKIGSGSWPCKADRQAVFCRTPVAELMPEAPRHFYCHFVLRTKNIYSVL